MLIMIAMDLAPVLLCEKSQFLRPMTISLTARAALLLDSLRRPSFRTFMNLSMCFIANFPGFYNSMYKKPTITAFFEVYDNIF